MSVPPDEAGAIIRAGSDPYLICVQIAEAYEDALDPERLHMLVTWTLAAEGRMEPLEVGITITNDEEIHALNKQYLDHDYPTDVLSFGADDTRMPQARTARDEGRDDTPDDAGEEPMTETEYVTEGFEGDVETDGAELPSDEAGDAAPEPQPSPVAFVTPPGRPLYLGDVVISYETAASQAADYGHSPAAEVDVLLIHGLLHLLGYDDNDPANRARMHARQDEIVLSYK